MHIVQGPISYIANITYNDINGNGIFDSTDTPLSTAYNNRGFILGSIIINGATNISISSFNNFVPPLSPFIDPDYNELYYRNRMLGMTFEQRLADPCDFSYSSKVFNAECSNISPYFWYSGDPVLLNGWINTRESDQSIMINSGPFDLHKNIPIDIIIAYTIGENNHPVQSVKKAKLNTRNVKFYFLNNAFEANKDEDTTQIPPEPLYDFELRRNYPNPFNPTTKIVYTIPFSEEPKNVTLKVYNLLGQEVATLVNEVKPNGSYSVDFLAENLSNGVYIYSLSNGAFHQSKKMMVLK